MIELERGQFAEGTAASDAASTQASHDALRTWVARELHDTVVQPLTTLLVEMELFKRKYQSGDVVLRERVDSFETTTRAALANLRHTICSLRAEPVRHAGFRPWLARLATELGCRGDVVVRVRTRQWPQELPSEVAYNLCRIVEEAIRNVLRHSHATRVSVSLVGAGPQLRLAIRDDGIGWSPLADARDPGHGIRGMAERALLLGGDLRVTSTPGRGTTVRLRFPREQTA